jgi:hypothetical protein
MVMRAIRMLIELTAVAWMLPLAILVIVLPFVLAAHGLMAAARWVSTIF